MRPEQYSSLCEEYGKTLIDSYVEKLNAYVPNRAGGEYKDYAAAIRSWILKDKEDGKKILIKPQSGPAKENFFRNKKICEFIEEKLQNYFTSRVFFQASHSNATLVSQDKDVKIEYSYDMDTQELKAKLLTDCNRYINTRAEEIITNKKTRDLSTLME